MRALHQALPPESRVFDDPLATRVVIPDSDAYRSRVALLERMPAALRFRFTHYLLRARFAEESLAEAVQQRGLAQFVILGGGLDTFRTASRPGPRRYASSKLTILPRKPGSVSVCRR